VTFLQLQTLVGRFGPVVDKWPASMIEPALELIRSSTVAQDFFAQASEADAGGGQAGGMDSLDQVERTFHRPSAG
jgi:hypothetical protein